ncbi:MAG TPA: hypothetical protein VIW24_16125 [Aldersonia sp.]
MWSFTQPAHVLTAAASIVVGIAVGATVVGVADPAPTTSVRPEPSVAVPAPTPHDLLCNPIRDRYGQAMRSGGDDAAAEMRDAGAALIQLGC